MNRLALGLSSESIREELGKILDSEAFDASRRNRLFLKYAVEETLAGRSDRIKAYTIATVVFGRDASFDPQLDSIVRIEAGRLRRSLERYYLTAGAHDVVRIEIPRGSYIPSFESPGPPTAALTPSSASTAARGRRAGGIGPSILVAPFEVEDDQLALPNFAGGFTRQVVVALTRFTGLFVFGPETSLRYATRARRADIVADLDVDYVLVGGMTISERRFEVDALLIEARSGRYVWGEAFARTIRPPDIVIARDEIANEISRILAQPYGIIYGQELNDLHGDISEDVTPYDVVLLYYQYGRSFNLERFEPVRAALERVICEEPGYAEAFACLSLMYTNAFRFRYDVSAVTDDPRGRALLLARRAIELTPDSSRALQALAMAYWFRGDVAGALEALESSRTLNPNDSEVLADLGLRYAMLADWDRATPLLQESFERNPAPPSGYRIGLFLIKYASGAYREAFAEARRIDAPQFVDGLAAVAIGAAQLGFRAEVEAATRALLAVDPEYGTRVVTDMRARNLHPDLLRLWVDGLRKAGVRVSPDGGPKVLRAV
jgi:adenylate cyclase